MIDKKDDNLEQIRNELQDGSEIGREPGPAYVKVQDSLYDVNIKDGIIKNKKGLINFLTLTLFMGLGVSLLNDSSLVQGSTEIKEVKTTYKATVDSSTSTGKDLEIKVTTSDYSTGSTETGTESKVVAESETSESVVEETNTESVDTDVVEAETKEEEITRLKEDAIGYTYKVNDDLGTATILGYTSEKTPKEGLTLTIPDQVTQDKIIYTVRTIGNSAFKGVKIKSLTIPATITTIQADAFNGSSLESLETTGLIQIGDNAFANNNISQLVLNSGLNFIGVSAFSKNTLTVVKIPKSVISIGSGAFDESANIIRE